MRSPLFGALATISIFIPLVAVPLLALFGMPQMSGMSAPNPSDDLKFVEQASINSASSTGTASPTGPPAPNGNSSGSVPNSDISASVDRSRDGEGAKHGKADPFADFVRPSTSENGLPRTVADAENRSSPPQKRPQLGIINEGNGLPQKSLVALSTNDSRENSADGHAAERTQALNWKGAIDRLNALGIRDFQLQPGVREGEFLFSCRFDAPTNPRITHRFEAEAAEPLDAVAEVLRQIDDWKAGEGSRPINRTASSDRQPKAVSGDPFEESASVSAVNVTNR